MAMLHDCSIGQLDYIFFWYGLAFLVLAVSCFRLARADASERSWRWLGLFGLLHGLNEWLDLLALSVPDTPAFRGGRLLVLVASFLVLGEFGRRTCFPRHRWLSLGLLLPLLATAAGVGWGNLTLGNIVSRYSLGLLGAWLAAAGLWRLARTAATQRRRGLYLAAGSLLLYGVAAGLIVPQAPFWPASWLNVDAFCARTSIPIQLLRALCATGCVLGIWCYQRDTLAARQATGSVFRWAFPALFVFMIVLGWVATDWRGHLTDGEMRQGILRHATAIARTINPERVAALRFTADDGQQPAFQRLRQQMIAYGRFAGLRSIYTLAIRQGRLYFGPENLDAVDPLASPPGTVYREPRPEIWEVFHSGRATTVGPYRDEYGTFVSGLAPVFEPRSGEVLLVVGVDCLAQEWMANVAHARLAAILATLVLTVILLVGFSYLGWYWHTETVLTVAMGVAGTVVLTLVIIDSHQRKEIDDFRHLSDATAQVLGESFRGIRGDLEGLGRILERNASPSRHDFETYAEPLVGNPLVQSWCWIPRVPAAERAAFEERMHQQEEHAFAVFEWDSQRRPLPVVERKEYYPLAYSVPRQDNPEFVGLDIASEATCQAVLRESLQNGLPGATLPLKLAHDPLGHKTLLALRPLCSPGDASVRGFAGCTLRPQAILNRILDCNSQQDSYLRVQLLDLTVPERATVLAAWPVKGSGLRSRQQAVSDLVNPLPLNVQPLFVFGRSWAIVASPDPRFFGFSENWEGPAALVTGLLLTAIVASFIAFLRSRQATLEKEVLQRTVQLRERENDLSVTLQSIGEAVIATDTLGRITRLNPTAEQLTGWPLAEALGRPLEEVCRMLDSATGETASSPVGEALRTEAVVTFRTERVLVSRDGMCFPVADSAAPIRDEKGIIRGAVLILHNVTEAVRARQTIREGELRLEMILQAIEVGIVVIDVLSHEVTDVNRKALALIGAPREEVVGAVCHRFLCPGTRVCAITDRRQSVVAAEEYLLTAQGTKVPILKTVVPMQIRGRSYLVESFVDITERKQMEESLRAATERLQAVISTSPLAMVLLDAQGIVTSWNPAAERILGWSEAEVRSQPLPLVPQRTIHDGERTPLQLAGTMRLGEECRCHRKDGSGFDARIWTTPVRDDRGATVGTLTILEDATAAKRAALELANYADALALANRNLEELNRAAESATQAKSAFLANMSHEIRTPVSSILGYADLLADLVEQPKPKETVATIKRNAQHLLAIINDILDLSEVESGSVRIERTACSPEGILRDVVALTQLPANAKGVTLALELAGPLPETIQSDPTRLRQILVNLVDNAVEGAERGEVRLVARLEEETSATPRLVCDVMSTGIGMTPEQLTCLFQPFQVAQASAHQKMGGTGLGLALSRRLAEMLGGEITVRSTPGAGSTFTLLMPTEPLEKKGDVLSPPEIAPAATISLRGRILVADDAPENQAQISLWLGQAGAQVTVVTDGQEALDSILSAGPPGVDGSPLPFDLVVIDMEMPRRSGWEATQQLREAGYPAPILGLTAPGTLPDESRCREVGCNASLPKPLERGELLALVDRYLAKPEPLRRALPIGSGVSQAQRGPSASPPVRILLAEDTFDIRDLVLARLEEAGAEAEGVENGVLAVQRALAAQAAQRPFDLILMDMQMPTLDGYQAVRQLRQAGYTGRIMALTAHAMTGDRQACLDCGCDDYLAKPVNRQQLVTIVANTVAARSTAARAPRLDATVSLAAAAEEVLISTYAERPTVARLLPQFVERLEERRQAMEAAAREGDVVRLKELAHQLKGAAGSYGYPSLSRASQTLEETAGQGDLDAAQAALAEITALCQAVIRGLDSGAPSQPTS